MNHHFRIGNVGLALRATFVATVMCLGTELVLAQVTSGTIFGRVKDSTGAYISQATVTTTSPEIGASRTVTTSDSGDFVVSSMPPGNYTITIEATGFKKLDTQGIVLGAADKLNTGEFVLEVGTARSCDRHRRRRAASIAIELG